MTTDSEGFAFETEVSLRYTDLDTYGHVNNAVYATFLEEARIDYLEHVLDVDADDRAGVTGRSDEDAGIVVASLELEFRNSVGPVGSVTVSVRVSELGRSSFTFEYEIRSRSEVAAVGETTIVAYDRAVGESRPIPDDWRERITSFEDL